MCVFVCVCVCMCMRERESYIKYFIGYPGPLNIWPANQHVGLVLDPQLTNYSCRQLIFFSFQI